MCLVSLVAAGLGAANDVSKRVMFKTLRDLAYSGSMVSTDRPFEVFVSELGKPLVDTFRFMPRLIVAKSSRSFRSVHIVRLGSSRTAHRVLLSVVDGKCL